RGGQAHPRFPGIGVQQPDPGLRPRRRFLGQQRRIEAAAARRLRASWRGTSWRRLKAGNEPPEGADGNNDQARDQNRGLSPARVRSWLAARPVMPPPPRQPQYPEQQHQAKSAERHLSTPPQRHEYTVSQDFLVLSGARLEVAPWRYGGQDGS